MPNPWAALDRLGLVLERTEMPGRGRYYHRERVIVVRKGLSVVEERAVLWHEIAHAVRGDVGCLHSALDLRQELAAWRYAARRAVPLAALLEALCWSTQVDEVADQLKTTVEMLEIRLAAMHPAERAAVRRRLAAKGEGI